MHRKQLSPEEILKLKTSHFELQAYTGATKHLGGLKATRELIDLCHIEEGKYILDVGCGVGITPCYIAKRYDCRVIGVDISKRMIDKSNERAKRKGVESRVEFKVADVQNLPFDDALFDVVIGESVTAFVEDKQRAVREYIRVTKPGGYIGFNEATWIRVPPPKELIGYVSSRFDAGVEFLTSYGWEELLEGHDLKDMVVRTCKINILTEYINRIRQLGFEEFSMFYKIISLYIKNKAFRKYVKETWTAIPLRKFFKYLGYGIYVGRK